MLHVKQYIFFVRFVHLHFLPLQSVFVLPIIVQVTLHKVRISQPLLPWLFSSAFIGSIITTICKRTSHGQICRIRHKAANRFQSRCSILDVWQRIEQSLRVWVPCIIKNIFQRSMFYNRASVGDPVIDNRNPQNIIASFAHGEIM